MKKTFGFSLIEFIIVLVVIGIVAGIIAPLMMQVVNATNTQQNSSDVNSQLQYVMSRMGDDIRVIRTNTATDLSIAASSITFINIYGNTITYALSGSNLTRNGVVMANNITGLTFTYLNSSGAVTAVITQIRFIRISLTGTNGGQSTTITTTIFPRNFI